MAYERLNKEGYPDPTTHMALKNIERKEKRVSGLGFRPVVYICSPFRGDVRSNIEKARRFCRFAIHKGAIPFAPHLLYPQFMDDGDEEERKLALFMGQVMLDKCVEVWVFGNEISSGMSGEIARAKEKGKRIRRFGTEVML